LSTYLQRTLGNLWKNSLRSRSRSRIVDWLKIGPGSDEGDAPELDPVDRAESAHDKLEEQDRAVEVRAAVAKLPPERRLVLLLREVEERSYEEIAAVTGVPVGTVRSRLARAREDLRGLLGDLS
jgi:RNA polymerase sigma-70 factor (ECF subfamily)